MFTYHTFYLNDSLCISHLRYVIKTRIFCQPLSLLRIDSVKPQRSQVSDNNDKEQAGTDSGFRSGGCKVFPEMRSGGRQRSSGVCGRTSATPLKPHLNMYFHNKILGPLNVFCQIFLQMFQQEGLKFFYNQFHLNQRCSLNFPYLYILWKHLQTSSHLCIFT